MGAGTLAPPPSSLPHTSVASDNPYRWRSPVRGLLTLAVVFGALYFGWQRYEHGRPMRPLSSPYYSKIGMTIDLPSGGAWKRPSQDSADRRAGNYEVYADALVRGARVRRNWRTADEFLLLMRLRAPGAAVAAGPAALAELREVMANVVRMVPDGQFFVESADCSIDPTVQATGGVRCTGVVNTTVGQMPYAATAWIAGPEDILCIAYASKLGDLSLLPDVVRSIR